MDCSIMSVPSNSLKLTDPIPCAVVIGVGAQQGIGAAVARRFADAGLKVYVVGRTLQKVENVAAEIRLHGGTAIAKSLMLKMLHKFRFYLIRLRIQGRDSRSDS
jgi:NAD(P)-dependent dehydrogenase (short-subunit alcohol dehydrogenase family)